MVSKKFSSNICVFYACRKKNYRYISFNSIVFPSRKQSLGNSVYQCCKNIKYSFMLNPSNLKLSQQKESTANFEGRVKKQTGVTFFYNHTSCSVASTLRTGGFSWLILFNGHQQLYSLRICLTFPLCHQTYCLLFRTPMGLGVGSLQEYTIQYFCSKNFMSY